MASGKRRNSSWSDIQWSGLLSSDGQPATTVADIQAAIRKHAIGDNVRLVIQRSGEPPRAITVPHTSDNPK